MDVSLVREELDFDPQVEESRRHDVLEVLNEIGASSESFQESSVVGNFKNDPLLADSDVTTQALSAVKRQAFEEQIIQVEFRKIIDGFGTYTKFLWPNGSLLPNSFPKTLRLVRPNHSNNRFQFINFFGQTVLERTEKELVRDLRRGWLIPKEGRSFRG